MFNQFNLQKLLFFILTCCGYVLIYAADAESIKITGVSDMLINGEQMLKVAAKWGGIATVIIAAISLGRGKLEGALAQTICKILIVVGLLMASFSYFGNQIQGFVMS